jgi:hypothetical protein
MRSGYSQTAVADSPAYSPRSQWSERRPNWWLRLASYGWDQPQGTIEGRERVRRSRLTAWLVLGLLIADMVLLPLGLGDPATLTSVLVGGLGVLVAAALNRFGFLASSGIVLVGIIGAAVIGALIGLPQGQLTLDALPAYDLLVMTVVVGATVLPRAATFVVAAINIALIVGDFYLQPFAKDLHDEVYPPAGTTGVFASPTEAIVGLLARPIALQVIIATVAYLWVRSADEAIRRADRAEEIATLEHTLADQKRQLDVGIQQLLQTHVRVANGDFSARAPLGQDHILWQISSSLNNMISRMQRAGQAEHQLRRTEEELRRLAAAIDDAQAGRQPLWPVPTGTAADLIIERVARGQRRRAPGSAPLDPGLAAQLGMSATPQGWPSQSSAPLSQSGYGPQGWPSQSSTPLGQGDHWGHMPGSPGQGAGFGQGMPELPATSPWAFPAQEPDQQDYQG